MEEGHSKKGASARPSLENGLQHARIHDTAPMMGQHPSLALQSARRFDQQQGPDNISGLTPALAGCVWLYFVTFLSCLQPSCLLMLLHMRTARKCSDSMLVSWATSSTSGCGRSCRYSVPWWRTAPSLACKWLAFRTCVSTTGSEPWACHIHEPCNAQVPSRLLEEADILSLSLAKIPGKIDLLEFKAVPELISQTRADSRPDRHTHTHTLTHARI